MQLHDVLKQAAARSPGGIALSHPQGSLTFGQLAGRAAMLSSALGSIAPPGERVAWRLQMPQNTPKHAKTGCSIIYNPTK